MPVLILFLFGLVLVIQLTSFLQYEGVDLDSMRQRGLEVTNSSAGITVLHLLMSSTGGNDWAVYSEPLRPTGVTNCTLFLVVVAFAHTALLNIVYYAVRIRRGVDGAAPAEAEQCDRSAQAAHFISVGEVVIFPLEATDLAIEAPVF